MIRLLLVCNDLCDLPLTGPELGLRIHGGFVTDAVRMFGTIHLQTQSSVGKVEIKGGTRDDQW